MTQASEKNYSIHYEQTSAVWELSEILLQLIPFDHEKLIFCCIGTDRSTGDALGPIIGSQLQQTFSFPFEIVGTLQAPLHALNIIDRQKQLYEQQEPYIVAIDACLGESTAIGSILVQPGPLYPGKAVNKQLPPIGDLAIKGIVNIGGFMEAKVLSNTRLHVTYSMGDKIARALLLAWQRHLLKRKNNGYHNSYNNNRWQQIGYTDFR
ncbi:MULTISPECIES: spore protease YyaC [Solibacillus]|uniref:Spore protease YyaC n=1 Tax=Solibacillus palustris TaxID=2908203 RepID=A0ABS9UGJ3_9BACL|nr:MULTISPECIES: spore protease YyaC [Solibacillus]MCH7323474.1 spore protease YyaC [Solibacillus sp. MA9]